LVFCWSSGRRSPCLIQVYFHFLLSHRTRCVDGVWRRLSCVSRLMEVITGYFSRPTGTPKRTVRNPRSLSVSGALGSCHTASYRRRSNRPMCDRPRYFQNTLVVFLFFISDVLFEQYGRRCLDMLVRRMLI
jgi:hypothetical protein